ncbi:MAG: PocR ligand-binding domain-containing protein [Synergistaceae bacterium]|jgi:AraC-like DNA-binding protein/ligand-binding sensor protein|nr:PocR ligand-binding domain-containing protein [Synergistaceae bacterium]
MDLKKFQEFDLKLAVECSNSYSYSTGLGCMVLGARGEVFHEVGYNCSRCAICAKFGIDRASCAKIHAYGTSEAERFGGKYVYFCPMGLNCFVSPIVGLREAAAKVTAGPFRMIDLDDYVAYDLKNLYGIKQEDAEEILPALQEIPYVEPSKVNFLSTLLFMAVGFMNNVSDANRMLDNQASDYIQGQINEYIMKMKNGEEQGELPQYPYEIERDLLKSVIDSDRPKAQKLLNELLGHIFFESGGDFSRVKTRVYEFIAMLSRTAIDAGASPEYSFQLSHGFFKKSQNIVDIDTLCFSLTKVTNQFIDSVFTLSGVGNANIIHKALQYMRQNYNNKVCLNSVAQKVNLSPSYFSKVFKKEMGCNFNAYMNTIRIEKSITLVRYEDMTFAQAAAAVGFDSQSYFTKVFKRVTKHTPQSFFKAKGRMHTDETSQAGRKKSL